MNVKAKLDQDDRNLLVYETRYAREDRLSRTGIPAKYWNCTWEDFEPREGTEVLRDELEPYVNGFIDSKGHGGQGFLFQGPPGVGKTMAACIAGVLLSDLGCYVRFMPLATYVDLLLEQMSLQQGWQHFDDLGAYDDWWINRKRIYGIRQLAQLLILDDVGKEHRTNSGYAEDQFDLLLRERVCIGRPVIMTSNIVLEDWAGTYSASMQSFVFEAGKVISVQLSARDERR